MDHPNLCPIYDVGEVDGAPYLTMAYIEGRPLSDLIGQQKSLPQRQVVSVVRKLALALQEAHDRGVVNRDLKPDNVLVSRKRDLVIVDFGLATRDGGGEARLTKSGMILGTPSYMSPEQAVGDTAAIGPGSDVYSLGVILYEMLTGQLPFEGSAALVLGQIMVAEPQPLSHLRADVDPRLESICLKAMSKRAPGRYASMTDFAQALTEYLRGPEDTPALSPSDAPVLTSLNTARAARRTGGATLVAQFFDKLVARQTLAPGEFAPLLVAASSEIPNAERSRRAPRWPSRGWVLVAAAASAMVCLLGVVIYVATDHGTVKIELNNAQVNAVVKIDGELIVVEGLGEPLRLRVGEHRLDVTGDGFEAQGESFTLRRGENKVVRLNLVATQIDNANQVVEVSETLGREGPPGRVGDKKIALSPNADISERVTFTARASASVGHLTQSSLVEHGWFVPFKEVAPTLDGRIDPGEYGPKLVVDFTGASDIGRIYWGSVSSKVDLSASFQAVYSKTALHIAVTVQDDILSDQHDGEHADQVQLYFDGDGIANDWVCENRELRDSNPEGFVLGVMAGGERYSKGVDVELWESAYERTGDGYLVEFRIPLTTIDTKDGHDYKPAGPGSTIGFQSSIRDIDNGQGDGLTNLFGPPNSPWSAGETTWDLKLRLARPIRFELDPGSTEGTIELNTGVFQWTPPKGRFEREITIEAVDGDNPNIRSSRTVRLERAKAGEVTTITVKPAATGSATESGERPSHVLTIEIPEKNERDPKN